MKFKYLLLLVYIFACKQLIGQSEAALPFLNYQQSSMLSGAGQIGVSIPSDLASGFYYNPAILGYSSLTNHVSLFYSSGDFKNPYFTGISANSFGVNAGYNLKKSENDLPLSLGFGYMHHKFNYNIFENSDIENYDKFDGLSFGAGFNYSLLFNIGFSTKFYSSVLADYPIEGDKMNNATASGVAFDFGTQITAPLSKLFMKEMNYLLTEKTFIKPLFNFSLGYSVSNIGNKLYYIDKAQADPLPRTARLGYTLDLGAALTFKGVDINLVNYSFTAEAEDFLIQTNLIVDHYLDTSYSKEYQGLLGDIKIGKNLINLEGDNKVIVHKGHIFKLLETVYITTGRMNGYYSFTIETKGIGFSSEGLFKFLSASVDDDAIKYIADHLSLEYFSSSITQGFLKREYQEISLKMNQMIF